MVSQDAVYLPPSPEWDYVTVKWAGNNLDGSPVTGTISLEMNGPGPFLDDDPNVPIVVFRKTITVNITSRTFVVAGTSITVGYAEAKIPAYNDVDVAGSNATYTLNENFPGGRKGVVFAAELGLPDNTIWLNRITPVTPTPGTPISVVYYADFVELMERVQYLEENGTPGGGGEGGAGESPQLRNSGTHIQWKYPSQTVWTNLVPLTDITGAPGAASTVAGPAGDNVQLRIDNGFVQWKLTQAQAWTNLVALSAITGPKGDNSTVPGPTGDSVQLRVSGGQIQWKPTQSSTWTNIIAIEDLRGQQGQPGDPTTVDNGAIPQAKVNGLVEALTARVTNVKGVTGLWQGTQAEYDAIDPKSATTIYFITAEKEIL
jgi:hypothetical protein